MRFCTDQIAASLLMVSVFCNQVGAQEVQEIAEKAARNFDKQYKKAGLIGLQGSVNKCYSRAFELKTNESVAYCFILDFMVADLSLGAQIQFGFPIEPQNTFANVNARVHKAFDLLGADESQRGLFTARWSREALAAFANLVK